MQYEDAIHIIEQKRRFGSLPGICAGRQLLAAVGNPQKDLAFIHIAGTNGKGSTAAFLRAVLEEAGIRTGLFTSPHILDFTERIQAGGRQIPKEDAQRIGKMLLTLDLDISPAMFDYCLAMALIYFKEQSCGAVVLETGLGGRLDATNAIDAPLVSIITEIGYDHTQILGGTLAEIASEKAGILKKGTRVVLSCQKREARDVLIQRCKSLGIPCKIVEREKIIRTKDGFSYPGECVYRTKLLGVFQQENAMAAVFAAKELAACGYPVTQEAICRGIASAEWGCRMEILCRHPFLLLDGAHNPSGARALAKSLRQLFPGEKFRFIMGVMADKDYRGMAKEILPLAHCVTAVTVQNSRTLPGEELAAYVRGFGIEACAGKSLCEVFAPFLEKEKNAPGPMRTIAFGSLYFAGDVKRMF